MPCPPLPPPNERTALNVSRSSDAERATESTATADNDSGRTGRSSIRKQDSHHTWKLRLAGATAAGTALLLLISRVSTTTTDGHALRSGSSSGSVEELSEAGTTQSTESAASWPGRQTIPSMQPFSTTNPADAHCRHMDRPRSTWPTEAWGSLINASIELHTSLPTNAWWENIVLGSPTQEGQANSLAVIPYTFDVAGETAGLRIHLPKVSASDTIVQTSFDWRHALQLGCVEDVSPHYVTQPGPLSVTLNWDKSVPEAHVLPAMSVPAVRGSPFATMEYRDVRPVISARQEVTELKVDGKTIPASSCRIKTSVRVEREAEITFSGGAVSSDDTWLVFVSEPTEFLCSSWLARERADPPTPGALGAWDSMPRFRLEAQEKMKAGVVRAALANNCTRGMSPTACAEPGVATDRDEYKALLRKHAEVYPTGQARVEYSSSGLNWIVDALEGDSTQSAVAFAMDGNHGSGSASAAAEKVSAIIAASLSPADANDANDQDLPEFRPSAGSSPYTSNVTSNEEGSLTFIWEPRRMDGKVLTDDANEPELISFALLHHVKALAETPSDSILTGVRTPTLHGQAEVAIGNTWRMKVDLSPVSFGVGRPVREEMVDDIHAALDHDVKYEMPANYLNGEGDTYFSGKMLAKMGRIALIAEEMGRHEDAKKVATRLAEASQVWLNGTAGSPLIYDFRWGGVVTCGCAYKEGHGCTNKIGPDECPGLIDPGMNFGLGFYNDHHFHFGYHIFAAAIAAKFNPEWGMKYYEPVTLLIRDIANPSSLDPFFPVFRHKDWFLGSSWALGIPTLGGVPYANGRNQESSSEAVNSYDAVALYGHVMAQVFAQAGDLAKAQTASLIRDTGRQLLATEVKAAQTYWQVKSVGTPGATRVYPEVYRPRVVGMLWSTLAQMQTWFGAEAWKVYGIQMLPITARSEQLLDPVWIEQMLPSFEDSCLYDTNPVKACVVGGWSMLVHVGQAITGRWEEAREGILALPDDAFETAGGNGHSRTSMLWFVANRPESADRKDSQSDENDEDGASENLSPESPQN